jgi:hypothetical protein
VLVLPGMKTSLTIIALSLLMFGDGGEDPDFVDSDNDGVQDVDDLCPGSDDTVDLNVNDIPDCSETIGPNLMFDDEPSIDAMTFAANTVGGWVPWTHSPSIGYDGNDYSESGTLVLYSTILNFGSAASVCVNVPLYFDYLGVWYQGRGGLFDRDAVLVYHEYGAKDCIGPATITTVYPGTLESGYHMPWPVLDDELELAASTRSVLIDFIATDNEVWFLDNILLLPRMASEQDDDPPSQD